MQEILIQVVGVVYQWILVHGIPVVLIIVGAMVMQYISHRMVERLVRRIIQPGRYSKEAELKREDTLIQVVGGTVAILIWVITLLTVLSEVGVAIGPILAAAGIAGIAIGFGGQYLIRDLISGMFIIVENQYRTGDVVCFDSTCGLVESITLRMTTLRDLDGTVHHVPHGEVKKVSNLSKYYARVNLTIGVSYNADLEKVIATVNAVGKELAEDEVWKDMIITPPKFLRVENFADSAVEIKILGDTKPMKQWDVAGELRMRLKLAFDREGIEIPFPQRVVHMEQK